VRVSYLELYNEELFDLLSVSEDPTTLKLRIYEDSSRKVYKWYTSYFIVAHQVYFILCFFLFVCLFACLLISLVGGPS